jgi:hypothetical protein
VQETLATNSSFATNRPVGHFGKVVVEYYAAGVSYSPPFLAELALPAHAGPVGGLKAINGAQSFFLLPSAKWPLYRLHWSLNSFKQRN